MRTNWKTTRLRLGAFLVVACAAVISFTSSRDLALMAGFGQMSWLFPICLDATAAVATDIWMRRSPAQRTAGSLAMTTVMASLASNVADHYLSTGLVLAALLGAVPPAIVAWMLLALHRHVVPVPQTHPVFVPGGLVHAPGPDPAAVPQDQPGTAPVPVPPVPAERQDHAPRYQSQDQVVPSQDHAPVPPRPTVAPPETDAEKTLVMAPIGRKVAEPGETRTKVQPAVRSTTGKPRLVSVPVGHTNEELAAKLAETGALPGRREVMRQFGIGTGRATTVIKMAEELMSA